MSSDDNKEIIKEGYLSKRGESALITGWQKRYIRIWSNKIVEYFVDDTLKDKKGTFDLNDVKYNKNINEVIDVSKSVDNSHHTEFGFKIVTSQRTWHFAASDENERQEWMKIICDLVDNKIDISKKKNLKNNNNNNNNNINNNNDNNNNNNNNNVYNSNVYSHLDADDDNMYSASKSSAYEQKKLRERQKRQQQQQQQQNNNNYNNNAYNNNNNNNSYNNNNNNNYNDDTMTLADKQQQQQEIKQRTDNALDQALQVTADTETTAIDVADKLHSQRKQLENVDQSLHEIDNNLTYSDHILTGMKGVGGMIHNLFTSKPQKQAYEKPDTSNVQTNKHGNNSNNSGNQTYDQQQQQQQQQHRKSSETDEKLDVILQGVKRIHAITDDINQELNEQDVLIGSIDKKLDTVSVKLNKQSNTMQKIT